MRERGLDTATRADGPRGGAYVPADGNVAAHGERADGVLAVEHDDEIGDVRADLEAPAEAAGRDAGGRGPGSVGEARNDEAGAGFAREDEAGLDDLEDGEAWRGRGMR